MAARSAPSLCRCQMPMFKASKARSVYRLVKVCQPTIRREFTSVTKATYTHPDNVRTYVISATRSSLGWKAEKWRSAKTTEYCSRGAERVV